MALLKVKLSDAREEYLRHLYARGLKPGSIRNYRDSLEALIRTCGDIYVSNISAEHIDKLFGGTMWQASTRNHRKGLYNTFFSWCRNRRYMRPDFDPMLGWRSIKVPEKDRLRIPVQEWGRLYAACNNPRKTALLSLGLYLFLRSSEATRLQVKHVDLENRVMHVYRTKTESYDEMPICRELEEHLRVYLTWYAESLQKDGVTLKPDHFLVPPVIPRTQDKGPDQLYIKNTGTLNPTRSISHCHRMIQQILIDAGYSEHMSAEGLHTLRRSGARAYFDSLVDRGYDGALRRVQSMLGHSNAAMTERYLGLRLDRELRNRELSGQSMFPEAVQNVSDTGLRAVK